MLTSLLIALLIISVNAYSLGKLDHCQMKDSILTCSQFNSFKHLNINKKFQNLKINKIIFDPITFIDLNDNFKEFFFENNINVQELIFNKLGLIPVNKNFFPPKVCRDISKIVVKDSIVQFSVDNNYNKKYESIENTGKSSYFRYEMIFSFENVKFLNSLPVIIFNYTLIKEVRLINCSIWNYYTTVMYGNVTMQPIAHVYIVNLRPYFNSTDLEFLVNKETLVKQITFDNTEIKSLNNLRFFEHQTEIRRLVYKNGLNKKEWNMAWLEDLGLNFESINEEILKNNKDKTIFLVLEDDYVDFLSNKYLCKFKYFNNSKKLIMPIVSTYNYPIKCTCTIYLLFKNYHFFLNVYSMQLDNLKEEIVACLGNDYNDTIQMIPEYCLNNNFVKNCSNSDHELSDEIFEKSTKFEVPVLSTVRVNQVSIISYGKNDNREYTTENILNIANDINGIDDDEDDFFRPGKTTTIVLNKFLLIISISVYHYIL